MPFIFEQEGGTRIQYLQPQRGYAARVYLHILVCGCVAEERDRGGFGFYRGRGRRR